MNANEPGPGWLGLAVALFLLGLLFWTLARGRLAKAGLPPGRVIYADSQTWLGQTETLYSPQFRLAGRPDYLVQEANGRIVPVELKSGPAPQRPYEGHVLQLAAYCLLVEGAYGIRPDYGILQYRDKAFAVDFTPELQDELLDLVDEMRNSMFEEADRSHDSVQRCARCGFRDICEQSLA